MPLKTRLFATIIALGLAAFASPAHAEEVPISEQARAHFRAGVNFMQDPDGARYDEAYREFREAYEDSPSWKILGNLAICAMKLERDGEAVEAIQKYLEGGGDALDPDERRQFERDLQTLQATVAYVTLKVEPSGVLITDERIPLGGAPTINLYGPVKGEQRIGIRRGRHRMTARVEGYKPAEWTFNAEAGAQLEHVFKLEPVSTEPDTEPVIEQPSPVAGGPVDAGPTTHRPIPTSVFVGLAATGALAAGGVVTGILASSKHGEFEDANQNITSPAERQAAEDLRDEGQSLNLVTDILLGGAVVAGGVTAVLYFTRPEEPMQPARLQLTPVAGRNGGGLFLSGRF